MQDRESERKRPKKSTITVSVEEGSPSKLRDYQGHTDTRGRPGGQLVGAGSHLPFRGYVSSQILVSVAGVFTPEPSPQPC